MNSVSSVFHLLSTFYSWIQGNPLSNISSRLFIENTAENIIHIKTYNAESKFLKCALKKTRFELRLELGFLSMLAFFHIDCEYFIQSFRTLYI